jgi:hypothetical protein
MTRRSRERKFIEVRLDVGRTPTGVLMAFAVMPGLSHDAIRTLSEHDDRAIRHEIASRTERLPADVIERLVADGYASVRRKMAERRDLGEKERNALRADAENSVRAALVLNPGISADELRLMADDPHLATIIKIARHHRTPADVIAKLAASNAALVRVDVARRNRLPAKIIKTLADDRYEEVRIAVARRRQLSASLIRAMARRPDETNRVLLEIADRSGLRNDVVEELSERGNKTVLLAIARNQRHAGDLSPTAVGRLLREPAVIEPLIRNPNSPSFAMLLILACELGSFDDRRRAAARLAEATAHEKIQAADQVLNALPELAERVKRILNPQ